MLAAPRQQGTPTRLVAPAPHGFTLCARRPPSTHVSAAWGCRAAPESPGCPSFYVFIFSTSQLVKGCHSSRPHGPQLPECPCARIRMAHRRVPVTSCDYTKERPTPSGPYTKAQPLAQCLLNRDESPWTRLGEENGERQ